MAAVYVCTGSTRTTKGRYESSAAVVTQLRDRAVHDGYPDPVAHRLVFVEHWAGRYQPTRNLDVVLSLALDAAPRLVRLYVPRRSEVVPEPVRSDHVRMLLSTRGVTLYDSTGADTTEDIEAICHAPRELLRGAPPRAGIPSYLQSFEAAFAIGLIEAGHRFFTNQRYVDHFRRHWHYTSTRVRERVLVELLRMYANPYIVAWATRELAKR